MLIILTCPLFCLLRTFTPSVTSPLKTHLMNSGTLLILHASTEKNIQPSFCKALWEKLGFPIVDFLGGSDGKESSCNAGDPGSIPGSARSSGEGNGYPLQYSCLEKSMDRGAWWASVHGVAKGRT